MSNIVRSRRKAITSFYKTVLGRDPDEPGLEYHCEYPGPLELVYMALYTSDEAQEYRKKIAQLSDTLPITLAMFVKDNEDSVSLAIESVKPIVREIVVVDTGSSDSTPQICESLGARVYRVGFSDFGNIRTITGHLARQPWVLGLDSDEALLKEDYDLLKKLIETPGIDVWGLPRKRWLDLGMTTQLEKGVYPDWQYRLFRNDVNIYYERRIHEIIVGTDARAESAEGPHIHHFQDAFKTGERLEIRNKHYKKLQSLDIAEGVEHTGKAVQDLDER